MVRVMGRVPRRKDAVFTTLGLIALAAGIIAVRLTASHPASSPDAFPSSRFATVARQLARADDLHFGSLPEGVTLKVSQSAAVATALKQISKPSSTNVSAFAAWSTAGYRMKNRPVWIVVIPDQRVRANLGPGQGAAPVESETLVVFVNANTGNVIRGSTV
jgi:hypothetical protein